MHNLESDRVNVLGVGVSAINMDLALETIERWLVERKKKYVCVTTANEIVQCQSSPRLRSVINRSDMVTPDGMPLVWHLRWHGYREAGRVYGPDLMLAVCEASIAKGYSHFFYGGAVGVAQTMADNLSKRFPGLRIAGIFTPPFRDLTPMEDEEVTDTINAANPDIVWVGLGGAKQDLWMAEHLERLHATVLIGVGAAFDFHSGRTKQAPRWMMRSGLEWVFRLSQEPRRLWRRYAATVPVFIGLTALQLLGLKRYSLPDDG